MTPPPDQPSDARGRDRRGGARAGQGGGGKPRGQGQGKGGAKGRGKGGAQGGGRPRPDRSRADELAEPLKRVLERIPATQREVLEWRMGLKDGHPHDLSSTAAQLGLSITETKEIEQRAFEHIREVVPLERLQKLLGH
ncbi:MAG TPA: sigma factor-like helix-turn-helix DNA-binding protein [Nitriliruptorales bacterium]